MAGPEEGKRHIPHTSHRETGDLGKWEQIHAVTITCFSYLYLYYTAKGMWLSEGRFDFSLEIVGTTGLQTTLENVTFESQDPWHL